MIINYVAFVFWLSSKCFSLSKYLRSTGRLLSRVVSFESGVISYILMLLSDWPCFKFWSICIMEKLPAIQSSHLVTRADVPLGMQMWLLKRIYVYSPSPSVFEAQIFILLDYVQSRPHENSSTVSLVHMGILTVNCTSIRPVQSRQNRTNFSIILGTSVAQFIRTNTIHPWDHGFDFKRRVNRETRCSLLLPFTGKQLSFHWHVDFFACKFYLRAPFALGNDKIYTRFSSQVVCQYRQWERFLCHAAAHANKSK